MLYIFSSFTLNMTMSEHHLHTLILYGWFGLAALTFPFLFFVTAPYGRYTRKKWGAQIGRTLGWVLMEAPSPLGFMVFFFFGDRRTNLVAITFLLLWQSHYLHRAFIFPFRMRGEKKHMTLITVLMGFSFNVTNAYLNSRYLNTLAPLYSLSWLADPRFLLGTLLFFCGLAINLHADTVLIHLRRPGDRSYHIPRGGLFRFVSCPNYFGEMIEWCGWALATWSLCGLAFAVWTVANLAPRAYTHHLWYQEQFPDYPRERKALVPLLF